MSVHSHPHHDRTARLLEARLDALAFASTRVQRGERAFDPQIFATLAATRHAVALELLSADEAGEIWAGVARRHPGAAWCRRGPGLAA